MTYDPHRESCRRQHRVLGHFLAIQAWLRGLDCIVLVRKDLEVFLGLKRFKSTRVSWLCKDLEPWFAHQECYFRSGAESSLLALFLSRVPIDAHLPSGTMTTEERIEDMAADAPKTARLTSDDDDLKPPSEKDIVRYLAILDSGLDEPSVLQGTPE